MSIERVERKGATVWRVRWRDGRGRNRARVLGLKRDAEAFEAEIKRRKRLGELAVMDAGRERLDDYVTGTWVRSHAAHLAPRTRQTYASSYDRHISPRLGHVPLREIDAETIAAFQGELLRSGVGPQAIRKAMTLLGAILQRAAEGRRIPYNPQRVVRKVRLSLGTEVRPLAPIRVEAMRGAAELRDATIVSILAYAGLRPGELRELRWRHVRERTLLVNAVKTGRRRTVRLLSALAEDLDVWREANGDPGDRALIFPDGGGELWTANGFEKWRQRRYGRLLQAAGLDGGRPYDLRHSFDSLLLHEGRDVIYVARQLGHGAELTLRTYGHVIEELEDSPQLPAEEAIRRARESVASGEMYPFCTRARRDGEGPVAGFGSVGPRPDLDSNQGPTP
jgi:integrase